jgi:peptide/nickel transport system substrate-binding protein
MALPKGAKSYFLSLFSYFKKASRKNGLDSQAVRQKELDKKLVYSLKRSRFPTWRQLKYLSRYLSRPEKRLFDISVFLLIVSTLFLGGRFYLGHLETMPVAGGLYHEALLGAPTSVNPLYSITNDVDSDLSGLVYSSLFKRAKNGALDKDLVAEFFVSSDNKSYEFTIRNDVRWHDGTPLTTADIAFTFGAINDPAYKSPLKQSFSGVQVEVIDDHNFRFVLASPYAAFLDLLTFGVMPAHLWSGIQPASAQLATLNLKPVGSGPFKFDAWSKDASGNVKEYKLKANEDYYAEKAKIDLSFRFYPNFEEAVNALNAGDVEGISYLPAEYREFLTTPKSLQFHKLLFPQITLIFFNQKKNPVLADKSVRQALAYSLDRQAIIDGVLGGDANTVDSPILANSFAYDQNIRKYVFDQPQAREILDKSGWKELEITAEALAAAEADLQSDNEKKKTSAAVLVAQGVGKWRQKDGQYLKIVLSTVERQENTAVIEKIKEYWEQIGVKTEIQVLEASQVQSEVLRNRNFEALFYAQVLGADPDPYAFWHSSQAEQGYNIASFSNKEVDKLLEEARLNVEPAVRQEKYKRFQEIVAEEEPVIFMYSPHYTYVQKNDIKGFAVENILVPKDRFSNITDWYLKTGRKLRFKQDQ